MEHKDYYVDNISTMDTDDIVNDFKTFLESNKSKLYEDTEGCNVLRISNKKACDMLQLTYYPDVDKLDLIFDKKTNPQDVFKVMDTLEESNMNISSLCLRVENKDYTDGFLEDITSKVNTKLEYDLGSFCNYEEFINMRKFFNNYKDLINKNDLSPLEKYVYAYDIAKSHKYHENTENKSASRSLHKIINDGDIVCVGYANFLSQLLKELDIKSTQIYVAMKKEKGSSFHSRCLVRIDDEKYNYHGIFASDPTFDSIKGKIYFKNQNGLIPGVEDGVVKEYDGNDLYHRLMVTSDEYREVFATSSLPNIFQADEDDKLDMLFKSKEQKNKFSFSLNAMSLSLNEFDLKKEVNDLFDDTTKEELESYIHEPVISSEQKDNLIRTVKKAEGYSDEKAEEIVNQTNEIENTIKRRNQLSNMFDDSNNKEETKRNTKQ